MRQRKIEDEDEVGTEMDGQMEGETDEPDTPRRLHRKHVDEEGDEDTEPTLIDYGGEGDEETDEMDWTDNGFQVEE